MRQVPNNGHMGAEYEYWRAGVVLDRLQGCRRRLHNMDAGVTFKEQEDARAFCEQNRIKPYIVEALEHWIVSNWLADKLEKQGEMILRGFLGKTIWGRTCSGQAIYMDEVIEKIYDSLNEKE